MTLKEIQEAELENERLYDSKLISNQEYIKKQIEIIEELDILLYKLEHFDFTIFKNIKDWFRKKLLKYRNIK